MTKPSSLFLLLLFLFTSPRKKAQSKHNKHSLPEIAFALIWKQIYAGNKVYFIIIIGGS